MRFRSVFAQYCLERNRVALDVVGHQRAYLKMSVATAAELMDVVKRVAVFRKSQAGAKRAEAARRAGARNT